MTDSGQLAANTTRLDNQDPDRDWGRPETGRTHIFNSSLILHAADARREQPGSRRPCSATGRSRHRRRRHRSAVQRLHRQPARTSTAGRPAPATTTTSAPTASPASRAGRPRVRTSRSSIRTRYTLNGFRSAQIGTGERGDCTGPGYFQTDLAFYKNFPLKSGVKVQFRWDIFNIFNNTNFMFAEPRRDAGSVGGHAQQRPDRDRQLDHPRPTSARRPGRGTRGRCRSASSCSGRSRGTRRNEKGDRPAAGRPFSCLWFAGAEAPAYEATFYDAAFYFRDGIVNERETRPTSSRPTAITARAT